MPQFDFYSFSNYNKFYQKLLIVGFSIACLLIVGYLAYEIQCIHYLANEINSIHNDLEKILVLVEKLDNKNQSQEVLLNEIRKQISHAKVVINTDLFAVMSYLSLLVWKIFFFK